MWPNVRGNSPVVLVRVSCCDLLQFTWYVRTSPLRVPIGTIFTRGTMMDLDLDLDFSGDLQWVRRVGV